MKYPNFKFSLRSFLIVVTVLTVFIGWRLEQRRRIEAASNAIRDAGGTVYHQWQEPAHRVAFTDVPNVNYIVPVSDVYADSFKAPDFQFWDFVLGTHNDITAFAVAIPISAVDQRTVSMLAQSGNLDSIVLLMDERFHSLKNSSNSMMSDAEKKKKLQPHLEQLERAKKLLKSTFPIPLSLTAVSTGSRSDSRLSIRERCFAVRLKNKKA